MSTPYVDKIKELGGGAEVQIYADQVAGSTWTNEAKAAHDLTITGATVVTSGGPATNLSRYVDFDGVDDRADTPHDADLVFSGSGSHGVWVWIPTGWGGSDAFAAIFSKGGSDYEFRNRNETGVPISWDPQASDGVNSGTAPPYGEWLFYVVVEDNTAATVYRVRSGDPSATVDASGTSDGYTSSTNPFALGARGSGSRHFEGRITGYFALPGVVLTQQQVFDIYTSADEVASGPLDVSGTAAGTSAVSGNATFGVVSDWSAWDTATTDAVGDTEWFVSSAGGWSPARMLSLS